MKVSKPSSFFLFMLELVLSILIFVVAATVCLSIFSKAHTMSREATVMETAVTETGNAAEIIRSASSREDAVSKAREAFTAQGYAFTETEDGFEVTIPDGHVLRAIFKSDGAANLTFDESVYTLHLESRMTSDEAQAGGAGNE